MRVQFIINDVDRCLSDSIHSNGQELSETAQRDIKEYAEMVSKNPSRTFIFCTGRSFEQLRAVVGIATGIEWIVAENGSLIKEVRTGQVIDLGAAHSAKNVLDEIRAQAYTFTERENIPEKENMVTIDCNGELNPLYFNRFMNHLPKALKDRAEAVGITYNWDPEAINVIMPITKHTGLKHLFKILAKIHGATPDKIAAASAYIGDSTSDIEGMKACAFAGSVSNGDEKNRVVHKFIEEAYIPHERGYLSPHSFAEGNIDCIQYFLAQK